MIEVGLAKRRSRKGIDDIRKTCESHPDETILHKRSIGNEDVEDIVNSVHAAPVDDLRSAECLYVLTKRHEQKSCEGC